LKVDVNYSATVRDFSYLGAKISQDFRETYNSYIDMSTFTVDNESTLKFEASISVCDLYHFYDQPYYNWIKSCINIIKETKADFYKFTENSPLNYKFIMIMFDGQAYLIDAVEKIEFAVKMKAYKSLKWRFQYNDPLSLNIARMSCKGGLCAYYVHLRDRINYIRPLLQEKHDNVFQVTLPEKFGSVSRVVD
jgi:hypothetical protein